MTMFSSRLWRENPQRYRLEATRFKKSGKTYFPLEPGRGGGRWNTLRALRVLRWWEGAEIG